MKVLQVISSFPPAYDYGGPPRSAYNLSKALIEMGHDVTVFTTDAYSASERVKGRPNPEEMDGMQVYRFRNVSNRLSWKNYPLAPKMLPQLLAQVPEFDVVHTHEYRSFHTFFTHVACQRHDVPYILQPRGSLPNFEGSSIKSAFDAIIGKRMIDQANRIIASSTVESLEFDSVTSGLNDELISHVPNGISGEDYEELPQEGQFRSRVGIPQEDDLILFLSRLHPRKGGDLLIEATANLSGESKPWLVFIGPDEGAEEGWKKEADEVGIGERTLFPGPQYGEEKLEAYVDADVFVLPSRNEYESFGNVVIEAMACGTPTVTTNICGVTDWLEHESSRLVDPTPKSIEAGIEQSLSEEYDSELIRSYALETFPWEVIAEDMVETYEVVSR